MSSLTAHLLGVSTRPTLPELDAIFNYSPAGIAVLDREGRIAAANPALCAIAGYTENEMLNRHHSSFIYPDDVERDRMQRAELRAGSRRSYRLEKRYVTHSGEVHWLNFSATALIDPGTGVRYFVVNALAMGKPQSHGAARPERFRQAFDDAPVGMVITSRAGRGLYANAAILQMLGYDHTPAAVAALPDLMSPEDTHRCRALLQQLCSGTLASCKVDGYLFRRDGSRIWTSRRSVALRDSTGRPQEVLTHVIDATRARRHLLQLHHLAERDPLTGLLNRRAFERALLDEVDPLADDRQDGAVLMIDLDRFKRINDLCGHAGGDSTLIATADVLRVCTRGSDSVARLGGDEFAALLPGAGRRGAARVAAAIVARIRQMRVLAATDSDRPVNASVGVAIIGEAATAGQDPLVMADLAMYEAKQSGGDRANFARRPVATA
jgi:diguanylate cyclase (GGDEF)-like protein/PAS domain S-box-containing protein